MTEITSIQRPVLLDLTEYNTMAKRATHIAVGSFSGLILVILSATFIGFLLNGRSFDLNPVIGAVALFGGIATAFLWKAERKSHRLYTESINSASAAIASIVQDKYNLDLVDPVVFDYRSEVVAGDAFTSPKSLLRISTAPQKAIDTVKNCYVEVILTLSEDNRDVTASVLTPAMVR